jgi:hypothetical protein
MSATSHRRWFQFSIRSVLAVMTVVAIGFGLWVSKLHRRQQALGALRAEFGATSRMRITFQDSPRASWLSGQKWLTRLVGEEFFDEPVDFLLTGNDPSFCDSALRPLEELESLKRLTLEFTVVGKEGMPYLRGLRNLERLDLAYSKSGDEALANMSELSRLGELDLLNTPITDAGLRHLSKLVDLKHLNLEHTNVTDEGIGWLKDLDELVALNLEHTAVRGATLRNLSARASLRALTLSFTKLDDEALASLGDFSRLEWLSLNGTPVTGLAFAKVTVFPVLIKLNLSNTPLSDEGLQCLPSAPALQQLYLSDTAITDDGMKRLAQFTALESLELRNTKTTGKSFNCLQTLPRLRHLDLIGTQVDDADVESLNQMCSLVSVLLADTNMTEAGLARLQVLGSRSKSSFEQQTLRGLAETTDISFNGPKFPPLTDVVDYLKQRHEIEIQFDVADAEDWKKYAVPVTCDIHGVSLLRGLEEMLAPLGMTVVYRHSVPVIMARPIRPALHVPELVDAEDAVLDLEAALSEKTDLDFADQPLSDVVDYLSQRHNILIRLDADAFRRAGIPTDVRVTRSIKGITLSSALGLMLEPLDLTCLAQGDTLLIRPLGKRLAD